MGNAVVRFEISGPDPAGLRQFYGDLFGWTIRAIPGLNYATVATAGDHINGGIGPAQQGNGMVTIYVETENLPATLHRAAALGGAISQQPHEVPGTVSLAMLADPAGNLVGLVAATAGQAPNTGTGSGAPVTWFEIMGPDPAALVGFYGALFGWSAQRTDLGAVDMSYWEVSTGSAGIQGGIGSPPGGVAYTTVYAEPGDLQSCLDKATELGGRTLLPPESVPDGPTISMLADPQGHYFGIYRRA